MEVSEHLCFGPEVAVIVLLNLDRIAGNLHATRNSALLPFDPKVV